MHREQNADLFCQDIRSSLLRALENVIDRQRNHQCWVQYVCAVQGGDIALSRSGKKWGVVLVPRQAWMVTPVELLVEFKRNYVAYSWTMRAGNGNDVQYVRNNGENKLYIVTSFFKQ